MKKKIKTAAVTKHSAAKPDNTGEDKLRQSDERYALAQKVPALLANEEEFAREAIAGINAADAPEDARRDVAASVNSLKIFLTQLREHLDRGEIGGAVLAAYEIGRSSQMIVRNGQNHIIVAHNRVRAGSAAGKAVKNLKSKREQFLQELETRIQKRGDCKKPSDTAIILHARNKCSLGERQAWRYWAEYNQKKKS